MEISNDAKLNYFPIGPSSLLGRTVAFRVLFCGSVAHLRRRLLVALASSMHKIKKTVGPLLLCLHPKNTPGVLVSMTLLFFLLRRHTNVHSWAVATYKRRFWRSNMRKALTFEEWSNAAKMLDKETPRTGDSRLYDEELVREKLVELRHRRQKGSPRDIVFYMRADLLRNLGDMCNPQLHKGRLQVPKLISEYIDEVSTQLRMVCNSDSDDLPIDERLSFMHETRHAFGRTALLLSGGATLGAFHIGVVRTLVEHKLLPRIIAGSSVGSIICAIASTRSDPELKHFFDHSLQKLRFFDPLGGVFAVVRRVATQGAVHEIRQLQVLLREITSNMTFQEAYDLTGRILGVTVCSPRKHEKPRCLNYLTSPHVLIWSAVTASCAFPGLFEAQELMAKNRFGELVPYHASFQPGGDEATAVATAMSRRWRDGSLESDLPIGQLKELFNVNHFIVSQANPHIAPILRAKELIRSYLGDFAAKIAQLLELEVKNRCSQILELGIPIGANIAKLFAQDWEGDVTIVMPATLSQYLKIIQNPTYTDLKMAADQGRQCTWEKLSAIRANCAIELVLDECVALLNHARRLKRREERFASFRGTLRTPTFSAHRRIPSWNCIAREPGTFSDDDTSRTPTPHPVGAGTGRRNGRCHRYVQDSSDSEAESPSFHSWARVSSPAVRTPDAGKPPRTPRSPDRRLQPPPSPNSIVVGHGDFLQTERTDDGFVFNVVRKEDLAPRSCGEQRLQSKSGGGDAEELLDSTHGNASDSGEEDGSLSS